MPLLEIRLPAELAERAVRAWERDDEQPLIGESPAQRRTRHRAAALALIGVAISERDRRVGDQIVVDVAADLVAAAIEAAEG